MAVRVRPFNGREKERGAQRAIFMKGKTTTILNVAAGGEVGGWLYDFLNIISTLDKENEKTFTFDYSYDSFDSSDENYATQTHVFNDLGEGVLKNAWSGFNTSLFGKPPPWWILVTICFTPQHMDRLVLVNHTLWWAGRWQPVAEYCLSSGQLTWSWNFLYQPFYPNLISCPCSPCITDLSGRIWPGERHHSDFMRSYVSTYRREWQRKAGVQRRPFALWFPFHILDWSNHAWDLYGGHSWSSQSCYTRCQGQCCFFLFQRICNVLIV